MNKQSIRCLAPFFTKHWRKFLVYGTLSLAVSGLDLGILKGGATLADQILKRNIFAKTQIYFGVFMVAAYLVVEIFRATQNYIFTTTICRIYMDLQNAMVQKTLETFFSSFHSLASGDILKRVFKDADKVSCFAGSICSLLFKDPIRILCFSLLLVWWSPLLFAGLCAGLFVVFFFSFVLSKALIAVHEKENKKEAQLYQRFQKLLQNWSLIKAFGMEKKETEYWLSENKNLFDIKRRSLVLFLFHSIGFRIFFVLGFVLFVWLGAQRRAALFSTPGQWIQVIGVVYLWAQSVKEFSGNILSLMDERVRADKLQQVLNWPKEGRATPNLRRQKELTQIDVKNLSFSYDGETKLFQGLHLELKPGKPFVLSGPNGSGKTTLTYLLLNFLEPSAGKILFNDVDSQSVDLAWLRSRSGVVFQQPFILEATLLDNLYYGLNGQARGETEQLLEFVGLRHLLEWQKKGKSFGETWRELSLGEKQKLALARAFLHDPDFLILDEATSSLNSEDEKQILGELFRRRQNKMTLVVSHRLESFEDSVIRLKLGNET